MPPALDAELAPLVPNDAVILFDDGRQALAKDARGRILVAPVVTEVPRRLAEALRAVATGVQAPNYLLRFIWPPHQMVVAEGLAVLSTGPLRTLVWPRVVKALEEAEAPTEPTATAPAEAPDAEDTPNAAVAGLAANGGMAALSVREAADALGITYQRLARLLETQVPTIYWFRDKDNRRWVRRQAIPVLQGLLESEAGTEV